MKDEPECTVCLLRCSETLLCLTPCGHKVCMDCVLVITSYTCPICRSKFPRLKNVIKARMLFHPYGDAPHEQSERTTTSTIVRGGNRNTIAIESIDEFPNL